MAHGGHKVMP